MQRMMPAMSRIASLLAAATLIATSTPAAAASFVGKWRAIAEVRNGVRRSVPKAVKMILHFKSGGAFKQTVTMGKRAPRPENGSWALEGGKLVVRSGPSPSKQSTRRFGYRISRGRLLLSTQYGKEKIVIQLRRTR